MLVLDPQLLLDRQSRPRGRDSPSRPCRSTPEARAGLVSAGRCPSTRARRTWCPSPRRRSPSAGPPRKTHGRRPPAAADRLARKTSRSRRRASLVLEVEGGTFAADRRYGAPCGRREIVGPARSEAASFALQISASPGAARPRRGPRRRRWTLGVSRGEAIDELLAEWRQRHRGRAAVVGQAPADDHPAMLQRRHDLGRVRAPAGSAGAGRSVRSSELAATAVVSTTSTLEPRRALRPSRSRSDDRRRRTLASAAFATASPARGCASGSPGTSVIART